MAPIPDMVRLRAARWWGSLVLVLVLCGPVAAAEVLDEFDDLSGWTAQSSPGASVELARDAGHVGGAMRLDFDFGHGAGFVIARKAFELTLPPNYAFTFQMRAQAPSNNLEFKLVDPKENVWWSNQRDFEFPADWRRVVIKRSRLRFAWGPKGGGAARRVAFIEIAIAAGSGGKGSVWLDELRLEEREVNGRADLPPKVTASTFVPGREPRLVLDQDPQTSWRSGALAAEQWLQIDFQKRREYGGLVIDWDPSDYATSYRVQTSDDGEAWTDSYASTTGNGGRGYIYMPDGESRFIRLALTQSSREKGYEIRSIAVKPVGFSVSVNQFFDAVAADALPGTYPKYLAGRQTYWTVLGADGDDKEALLNEEGMLEVDKRGFSIEPFVYAEGALVTWNDVETGQALEDGYLPIATVTWRHERVPLDVTAFVAGPPGASVLYATYGIENRTDAHQDVVLFLTIRPFQVLPPWQNLNMVGGATPIRSLEFETRTVWVNGEKAIVSLTAPDGFGAATFEQGLLRFLLQGRIPLEPRVTDPFGYASGTLSYRIGLDPGSRGEVRIAAPFYDPGPIIARAGTEGPAQVDEQHERTVRAWESLLGRVEFRLPAAVSKLGQILKTTLAYILINRDGAAIQPGSRNYARSWIRDGAFTATALLELGCTEEARDFIRWFAQYQLPDGRIPCCVDRRGADSVPEHDSNGEFIYTVAEYYRFTRDVGFLHAMWPAVVRAVESIAALRAQRTTEAFTRPDKQAFYGLLPESISHEGYSSHPVHSYWDDFFALRGLKDAATLAPVVGDDERAPAMVALRDAFQANLHASIVRAMARHKVDYIPASVELGDLDPSSTAIAIVPVGEATRLPQRALASTFELYWQSVQARQKAGKNEGAYSPYELRNVGVLIRLGQRERALELLEMLVADQRPPGWNEWQEVVWLDPTAPHFIGDMPHTWVAAGFIHALRSMFAYEREEDRTLVLAAGLPWAWVMSEDGVEVRRLPTHYGVLSYSLRSVGPNALRLQLHGDLSVPPGGLVIQPPLPGPLQAVTVNGRVVEAASLTSVTISEFPAEVAFEYQPQSAADHLPPNGP